MKKLDYFLTAAVLSIAVLSGCSAGANTGNSTVQNENSISQAEASDTQEGKVITDYAIVEYAELADTLKTLTDSADWIAKVEVTAVTASSDGTYTEITPNVLETYQGSYDGQTLCVHDCIMPYADAPASQESSGDEAAMYHYDHAGNYIPQTGDVLLFFGTEKDGSYWEQYSYQGMFLLRDGGYVNQALGCDSDPLAEDLQTLSGAKTVDIPAEFTRTENDTAYTFQNRNAQTVSVPEQTMTDAVQGFLNGTA